MASQELKHNGHPLIGSQPSLATSEKASVADQDRERHLELVFLLRRFQIQLRYGCHNPQCQTPHCHSCRKRLARPPVRRPSPLTARMMSYVLATDESPYSKLCPHKPAILPQQLDIELGLKNQLLLNPTGTFETALIPVCLKVAGGSDEVVTLNGVQGLDTIADYWTSMTRGQAGSIPDRKSISQKLFHSRRLRDFEMVTLANRPQGDDAGILDPSYPNVGIMQRILATTTSSMMTLTHCGLSSFRNGTPEELSTRTPPFSKSSPARLRDNAAHNGAFLTQVLPTPDKPLDVETSSVTFDELCGLRVLWLALFQLSDPPDLMRLKTSLHTTGIFVHEVLATVFGTSDGLIKSFREDKSDVQGSGRPNHTTAKAKLQAFDWDPATICQIYNYISGSLDDLFNPPPSAAAGWKVEGPLASYHDTSKAVKYICQSDAIHMLHVAFIALIAPVASWSVQLKASGFWLEGWQDREVKLVLNKAFGDFWRISHHDKQIENNLRSLEDVVSDYLFGEPVVRLMKKIVAVIAARSAFQQTLADCQELEDEENSASFIGLLTQELDAFDADLSKETESSDDDSVPIDDLDGLQSFRMFIYMLHVVLQHSWTSKVLLDRWQGAGAAMEILQEMDEFCESTPHEDIARSLKQPSFLDMHFPAFEAQWLLDYTNQTHKDDPNVVHILSCPAIYGKMTQTRNFRALNYARMNASYRRAGYFESLQERLYPTPDPNRSQYLRDHLEKATSRYLLLNVGRETLLEDTMDQLWRRQHRELLRPLKVRMGMDLGEQGVDQGGVSQEYFRLVFRKLFDPDAGLFQMTDEKTKTYWFQPFTYEPPSTFQLLGLLMAIGIYNGLTLSVSFPQILYDFLFRDPKDGFDETVCNLETIKESWPSQHKSFKYLLDYDGDDVEDVFGLDWPFDLEANGKRHHLEIEKFTNADIPHARGDALSLPNGVLQQENQRYDDFDSSSSDGSVPSNWESATEDSERESSDEAETDSRKAATATPSPVTNENRESYTSSYIHMMLWETVAEQMRAFQKGFHFLLPPHILAVLEPITLRALTEGHREINIRELRATTNYEDGYDEDHPTIVQFWKIVESYAEEKHRKLLNFVTASDRVPMNGMGSVTFSIVRAGSDSELLPTSSTCFGKLLIPEYSSERKLRQKLDLALESSVGFGAA